MNKMKKCHRMELKNIVILRSTIFKLFDVFLNNLVFKNIYLLPI